MSADSARRAVMFADVAGSSALYKRLGNSAAKALVDASLEFMVRLSEANQGVLVKTIGDEVMVRFDQSANAAQAAQAIQREAHRRQEEQTNAAAIRIGLAAGDTLLERGDLFGEAVNDAAAVARIAKAGQIILSDGLWRELPPEQQQRCQLFDRVALKGGHQQSALYRLSWEESDTQAVVATQVMDASAVAAATSRLRLITPEGERVLRPEDTPFVIGRDSGAHLVIPSSLVSRDHCRIVFQHGKFTLVDHSTNGTYVTALEADELYLRRGETPLLGRGSISPGRPARDNGDWVLRYAC